MGIWQDEFNSEANTCIVQPEIGSDVAKTVDI